MYAYIHMYSIQYTLYSTLYRPPPRPLGAAARPRAAAPAGHARTILILMLVLY